MTARMKIPAKQPVTYRKVYTVGNGQMTYIANGQTTSVPLSAATTQGFVLTGLPADWVVTGVRIQNLVQWAGTQLQDLQVQIVNDANPSVTYSASQSLVGPITNASVWCSSPFTEAAVGAQSIIVQFVSAGCNMSSLTAGRVEIIIRIEPI